MRAISNRAKMSEDYTRKRVNELIEYGYVKITKKGGGRSANTYLLEDISVEFNDTQLSESSINDSLPESALVNDTSAPLVLIEGGITESSPALANSSRGAIEKIARGNNKNKTINIEQNLSIERGDVLKILKICNDFRSRRFDLDPLNEEEEHLKHISKALKANSYEDVERVAKHYFATADCEFLNTYNAFNLLKLRNKIQRARDYKAQDSVKDTYKDIPLAKLISGARHA